MVCRILSPFVFCTVLLFFGPAFAIAHDLWLIPQAKAAVGKPVLIHANVGMDFPNSEHAPDTGAFARRVVVAPGGKRSDLSADGKDELSGLLGFTPQAPGIYVIGVETKPQIIALAADDFNAYLVSDGLAHIFQLRAKEKTLNQPARERYQKSPKALVKVGDGSNGDAQKPMGLFLEIVPLNDPFSLKVGATLKVRVDFQGKPLRDANLGWSYAGDAECSGSIRSDRNGEALVPIARQGLMTIRLTHMTLPKNAEYEWESFWTTLTFRVPE